MKQIKVESCQSCPYEDHGWCENKPMLISKPLNEDVSIPSWCPLEDVPEWIKTSERLPEIGEEVNVLAKDGFVTSLYRKVGREGTTDYFWDHHYDGSEIYLAESIIAWQPLPAPPKEDE